MSRSIKYLCIALLLVSGCKKKETSFDKLTIEEQNSLKRSFLERASYRDDEGFNSMLHFLSKGVPVNTADSNGFPATHIAIVNHSPKVALYLLEHGADVNSRAVHNLTPALYASNRWSKTDSDSLRLLWRYLVEAGADPASIDDEGNNVIIRAVIGGFDPQYEMPTIVDEGYKNGGICSWPGQRVEGKGESGDCDIVYVLKLLLEKGGSPDLKNNKGISARMYTEKVFRDALKSQGVVADSANTINEPYHAELYLFKNNKISPACNDGVVKQ